MFERLALVATVPKMTFQDLLRKVIRKFNSFTCVVMNGGHELYIVRNEFHKYGDNRLFQRCLLCQHETKGFHD